MNNTHELETRIANAKREIEAAEKELAALKAEENDPLAWVKDRARIYYIDGKDANESHVSYYHIGTVVNARHARYWARTFQGFQTAEAAERELLLREARFTAWKPKDGERYCRLGEYFDIEWEIWRNGAGDYALFLCGNIARTEEEMRERVKKYGVLWGVKQ